MANLLLVAHIVVLGYWLGSELVKLEARKINDSTFVFISRWRDEYEGQADDFSCGWYLVGQTAEGWRITSFADYNCED